MKKEQSVKKEGGAEKVMKKVTWKDMQNESQKNDEQRDMERQIEASIGTQSQSLSLIPSEGQSPAGPHRRLQYNHCLQISF